MPARVRVSASTPTMPVGPSYVDGARPSLVISCRSPVEVDTGIGRVCGVSASSEPSRCTRFTFAELSAEASRVANWRQRRFGSSPSTSTRSRPSGSGEIFSSVVGQLISRCPSDSR